MKIGLPEAGDISRGRRPREIWLVEGRQIFIYLYNHGNTLLIVLNKHWIERDGNAVCCFCMFHHVVLKIWSGDRYKYFERNMTISLIFFLNKNHLCKPSKNEKEKFCFRLTYKHQYSLIFVEMRTRSVLRDVICRECSNIARNEQSVLFPSNVT